MTRKFSDAHLEKLRQAKLGSRNPRWLTDAVGYEAVHWRLRRQLGPASDRTCRRCPRRAETWAYDHECAPRSRRRHDEKGPFSTAVEDYIPLCRPCHRSYDAGARRADQAAERRTKVADALPRLYDS